MPAVMTDTIYREIPIVVEYRVTPYYRATLEQPAEGGQVEVLSATYGDIEIELTPEEIDALDLEPDYEEGER